MHIRDLPNNSDKQTMHAFQIISEQKSFNVIAPGHDEKYKWVKTIIDAIKEVKTKGINIKSDQDNEVGEAPVWIPDSDVKACQGCGTKFTFTNRRHHCRKCGSVVCGDCTSHKLTLPGQGKQRVCDACFNQPSLESPSPKQDQTNSPSPKHHQNHISSSEEDEKPIYKLEALFDYTPPSDTSTNTKKLKFKQGDKISIFITNPSGWWLGEVDGTTGWVPASYLEEPKDM